MKPIVFDEEARAELDKAAEEYEALREGLGDDFVGEIRQGLERIEKMPQSFSHFETTEFRKCILRRFPYTIYFSEEEDRIWIAAVAHQRRRPGYWLDRQPE